MRALNCAVLLSLLAWPTAPGAEQKQGVSQKAVVVPPPAIPATGKGAREVATQVADCAEAMSCPFLFDFKQNNPRAFRWLQAWCLSREGVGDRPDPETHVCTAANADDVDQETKTVTVFDLVEVAREMSPPTCSGFGLVLPLYSVRHVGQETVPSGPVKAGLGGGYYLGVLCKPSFSFGPEFFGYSEGLDPSGLLQVGVGAGLQMVAFKYFQFGLAVGYDVYRREAGSDPNGLLAAQGMGKASVSWLITFTVFPQQTQQ